MQPLKRFYKNAAIRAVNSGYEIALDGRAVKTPLAAALVLPTQALADAIAEEWSGQGDFIVPGTMPLTQMANTVLDKICPARDAYRLSVAAFGQSDLVCHRAESPAALVSRQDRLWTPLVDWASERYGARLAVGQGVMPLAQPRQALSRLEEAVRGLDDWALAAAGVVASVAGSLLLALAVVESRVDGDSACQIALLDDIWQSETWGEDKEESARQRSIASDIKAAVRFVRLSRP